jgi:hypothetical protein
MSKLNRYRVIREHTGDRFYHEGDTRIGTAADLGHLDGKLLELIGPAEDAGPTTESAAPAAKAEPEPLNKAEPAAPANKAASQRKSKHGK